MHQFDEHHAELKGFSKYFHDEIFPVLAARDGKRREAVKTTKKYCAAIAAAMLFAAIMFQTTMLALMAGGAAMAGVYQWQTKTIKAATKDNIVGGICQYLGWTFTAEVVAKPNLDKWSSLGLIPSGYSAERNTASKRVSFEDEMSGEAHGATFRSLEIHMERKGDKSYHTVLRGQMIAISFPRKFLGRTVVLRDKGRFQRKTKGDMKRVGLVDPVFEKIFEAYGTDQVEARYLLTPDFMQTLVDLEESVDGKNIRFGFIDGQLLIVVETPNRYEAGSMFEPLTKPERTQKILDEVGAIYDVIDAVLVKR